MKYSIYEIKNQHGDVIYIGMTNNPKRRWSEHKSRAKRKTNKFYKFLDFFNWTLDSFAVIKTFDNASDSKLFEAYRIGVEIIEKENDKLCNQRVSQFNVNAKRYNK